MHYLLSKFQKSVEYNFFYLFTHNSIPFLLWYRAFEGEDFFMLIVGLFANIYHSSLLTRWMKFNLIYFKLRLKL